MTDSFVTRCPHCGTRLRVTYEQISAAAGLVRCGTCLHTFNAQEHLLEGSGEAAAGEMDELLIHDDLDLHDLGLDDLNLDEELAQIEAQEQAFSKELLDLSQQIEGDDRPPSAADDDEAWAEALLREEEENNPTLSLLNEDAPPKEGALWLPYKKSPEEQALKPSIDWDNVDVVGESIREVPITPFPSPQNKRLANKVKIEPKGFAETEAAEDETLFEQPLPLRRKSSFAHKALWGALCLALVLVLAGQFVFFNFGTLVRQEHYRPLFAAVCPVFGCKVPSQMELNQIRTSNLVVRSHPSFSGALMVDVILYNRADFAQPFPMLELEFSNLAGHPMAKRRFAPAQYLAGEMQGKQQMPSQVPIHIALEIQAPGKEAVNYHLNVLQAE